MTPCGQSDAGMARGPIGRLPTRGASFFTDWIEVRLSEGRLDMEPTEANAEDIDRSLELFRQ